MATKKKLLQAAAGSASGGAGALNVEDVFSTYLYEGNGGVQAVGNGINLGQNNDGSSVYFKGTNSSYIQCASSSEFNLGTGDYTIECWFLQSSSPPVSVHVLFDSRSSNGNSDGISMEVDSAGSLKLYTNSLQFSGGSATTTDWNHYAITRSNGDVYGFINGTQVFTGANSQNHTSTVAKIGANIPLNNYTKGYISNLRLVKGSALYTSGFTPSTSPLEAVSNTSLLCLQGDSPLSDNSGNSISLTNNNVSPNEYFGPFDAADAGEGGMVWFKQRNGTYNHVIFDTERWTSSNGQGLFTNATNAAGNINELASFNANGFTVKSSGYINDSTSEMASWTFRKAPKFFDVVTYTGNGTAGRTVSHNLGTTPAVIMIKALNSAQDWAVYHRSVGATKFMRLNTTAEAIASTSIFNDTEPTATEFTVGTNNKTNGNYNYVAYLFAHNDGDGDFGDGTQDIIKCGSYTGNGSSTGPEVDLGFEPQFLIVKNASTSANWGILDNMRGVTTGGNDALLFPDLSNAEVFDADRVDFNSTGFTVKDTGNIFNGSGNTYIYIAIRRGPMAVPTDATDVFDIDTRTGSLPSYVSTFPVDMALRKLQSISANWTIGSRLTGTGELETANTNAEGTDNDWAWDYMEGYGDDPNVAYALYSWMWKRAPNFFDVVAYTGNSTSGRTVSHNLGVAPEMIWVKNRDSPVDWWCYHKELGNTKYIKLNTSDSAFTDSTAWNNTTPTDTVITLGNSGRVNYSNDDYIAYLFASLDGVSKVGSYTGTGSTLNIDCGFSSGARFILIKRTDSSPYDWFVWDSERGIVAGNDPRLNLNTTNAEVTTQDDIDPYSSGFTVSSTSPGINTSGGSYIFYAIA
jgi:hypothetical protein